MTDLGIVTSVIKIAEQAGDLVLSHFRGSLEIYRKDAETVPADFATTADFASQEFLLEQLKALHPNSVFVAEEDREDEDSEATDEDTLIWHVDPIDATVNFSRGVEYFAISIAAVNASTGKTVLGVVHAPAIPRTWFAYSGKSYVKDGSGEVTEFQTNHYETSHILSGGFARGEVDRQLLLNEFPVLLKTFRDIRMYGSAALHLCFVAEGRVDAYIEVDIYTWDFMAGKLIAENAGVSVGVDGNPRTGKYTVYAAKTGDDFKVLETFSKRVNVTPSV